MIHLGKAQPEIAGSKLAIAMLPDAAYAFRLRGYTFAIGRSRHTRGYLGREIAGAVEIGDEPRLRRLPAQQLPGLVTRRRIVERCEMREPAKVLG